MFALWIDDELGHFQTMQRTSRNPVSPLSIKKAAHLTWAAFNMHLEQSYRMSFIIDIHT
jgi:hypothetical protein